MKKSNDTSGNRTRDLSVRSAVPEDHLYMNTTLQIFCPTEYFISIFALQAHV